MERGIDAGWGHTFSRSFGCTCLANCTSSGRCPIVEDVEDAAACDAPLSCVPKTVQSSFLLKNDNHGLMRWPPTLMAPGRNVAPTVYAGPPQLLVEDDGFARWGFRFNHTRSHDLAGDVHCLCAIDARVWRNATVVRTLSWEPVGFHFCVRGLPLLGTPAPWCPCGGSDDPGCSSKPPQLASSVRARSAAAAAAPPPPRSL